MPAAAAKTEQTKFQMIAVEKLHESIFNPRKTFEADGGELVRSVQAKGILQPLLVRPMRAVASVIPGEFEIICGHRRARAAREAGLTELPCVIRDLSDEEAIEAALIENAARQGVPALEEADALSQLVKQYGHTVQGLVTKLGKSESTIRSRLKLAAIGPEGRKAIEAKQLEPQLGMLIAIRVPNLKLQAQAVKDVLTGGDDGAPMPYKMASAYLRRAYMLEIKETGGPFDPADVTLCPAAGACYGCPKRSDSQPDLFTDVAKGPPLCLDPQCFREKEDAAWDRRKAAAQREGKDVLSAKRAEELFHKYSPGQLAYDAPFRELDDRCYEDPKNRTYRQLLPKDARTALVRDREGKVHELIALERVPELLKEAGHDFSRKREPRNDAYAIENRKREKEAKRRDETGKLALAAIVERHTTGSVVTAREHDTLWRFIFARVLALTGMEAIIVAGKRRGIVDKADRAAAEKGLEQLAGEITGRELEALVIELSIAGHAKHSQWSPAYSDQLKEVCETYGVDLKKLDAQTKAEAKNPKKLPVCSGYQRADGVRVKTCTTRVPSSGPRVCTKCQKLQSKEDAKAKKGRAA
jgi:ParB/RepB/Spo0J family partition protein